MNSPKEMNASKEMKRITQAVEVSRLHYEEGLSQSEISKRTKLSRPTISRLIQYAKENGIIRITVENPLTDANELSQQLTSRYGIEVHVVPNHYKNETDSLENLGHYAADWLAEHLKPNDILGVGWGKTMFAMSKKFENHQNVEGVRVVQLKGGASLSEERTYAYEITTKFAETLGTRPTYLPLPTVFEHRETKELIEKDRYIKQILELGKKANIAVYTAGTVRKQALLFQLDYLSEQEKRDLHERAVGDIVSRFVDKRGNIVNATLNARTVGISLEELKKKEKCVLLANGFSKVPVVKAAIRRGYCNILIIDQVLAQNLL